MDLGDSLGVVVVVGGLLCAPALVRSADAQGDFSVSWAPHLVGGRDAAVKGYVDNRSQLRIGDVHLRVETLDAGGKVIGEAFGWVTGDVARRRPGLFRRPRRRARRHLSGHRRVVRRDLGLHRGRRDRARRAGREPADVAVIGRTPRVSARRRPRRSSGSCSP